MDGQDGLIGKELVFNPGNLLVVFEISSHLGMVQALQMASGYHSGSDGPGCMIHEFIEQVILTGEDDGQEGLGIVVELAESLELGQNFKPQEVGLIDHQHRGLFSLGGL